LKTLTLISRSATW